MSSAGWVDLEYTAARAAGQLTESWSLDGDIVTSQTSGALADSAVALRTIIVNSMNFGDAQTYYYDDIKIIGVPDSSEAAMGLLTPSPYDVVFDWSARSENAAFSGRRSALATLSLQQPG